MAFAGVGSRPQPAGRVAHTRTRLLAALAVGVVVGAVAGVLGPWEIGPLLGWVAAGALFVAWAWIAIGGFDAPNTRAHATREDPTRAESDLVLLGAAVASLAAVGLVVARAHQESGAGKFLLGALAIVSVLVSWSVVHTVFALRYASLYYSDQSGGIDFHDDHPPRYTDFAYLAFTVGMTFQVSDTEINLGSIRAAVLRHALLAYVFGAVIVASVINLLAGLSQ